MTHQSFIIALDAPILNKNGLDVVTVYNEDDVRLNCQAHGDPPPEFNWYQDGEGVNDVWPMTISDTMVQSMYPYKTTLVITQAIPSDSGTYRCEARNSIGGSSRNFQVDVRG